MRVDDLDRVRCRASFTKAIYDDLRWLEFDWYKNPSFQSKRWSHYAQAIVRLRDMDLLYPCYLTRRELAEIIQAPHGTPDRAANMAPVNTDQMISTKEQKQRVNDGQKAAWRLRMKAAIDIGTSKTQLTWRECALSAGAGGSHRYARYFW